MDTVSKATRSRMMAAVPSKDTAAEVALRRCLFRLGYRYRLHARNLPGKPDLVFPKHNAVVFVNGCFWHYHGCRKTNIPALHRAWWQRKLARNRQRDATVLTKLHEAGWRTLVVWESSLRVPAVRRQNVMDRVTQQIAAFLNSERQSMEIAGSAGSRLGREAP